LLGLVQAATATFVVGARVNPMSTALLLLGLVQAATATFVVGANPTPQRCRFASPAMMAKKVTVNKDVDVRRRSSPLPDGRAQGGERRHNSAC